jgi:hypothetical protein
MSISNENVMKRYAEWFLTPKFERMDDEKTLTDFSEKYDISAPTLRRWKSVPYFQEVCNKLLKQARFGRIMNVKNAVYETAISDSPTAVQAAKLFKEWEGELPQELKVSGEVKATVTLKDMIKAVESESNESDK